MPILKWSHLFWTPPVWWVVVIILDKKEPTGYEIAKILRGFVGRDAGGSTASSSA